MQWNAPPLLRWGVVIFALHAIARFCAAACLPHYYPEILYWERSLQLAFGYAEHPPIVAWALAFCGWLYPADPILAGRFLAVAAGTAWPIVIAWLTYQISGDRRTAALSGLIALGLPSLAAIGTMWASDTPFLLFQLLGLCFFWSGAERGGLLYWTLAGACFGLALMSQLLGVLTVLSCAVYLISSQRHRHQLGRPGPWIGLLIAGALFAPYVWWNVRHGWPIATAYAGKMLHWSQCPRWSKWPEILLEQLPNGSVLSVALIAALLFPRRLLPQPQRAGFDFLRLQAVAILLGTFAGGLFFETHPNWTLPAYPLAAICAALAWKSAPWRLEVRWLRPCAIGAAGLMLVVGFTVLPLLSWMVRQTCTPDQSAFHAKLCRVQRAMLGWTALERRLAEEEQAHFSVTPPALFTLNHGESAIVGYLRRRPLVDLGPLIFQSPQSSGEAAISEEVLAAGGLLFAEKAIGLDPALHEFFETVEPLPPFAVRQGNWTIRNYALYAVGSVKPAALKRWHDSAKNRYR
jgi:4-amino-4-deoxy-L-arabinose transferase-like glycosyltransferase